ncbi:hypothetical protein [Microbacterium azadirachtae]|nr:hypothetical protein [Microbacterium azadirachtae]
MALRICSVAWNTAIASPVRPLNSVETSIAVSSAPLSASTAGSVLNQPMI